MGQWLIKYDPALYARGELLIDWPWWAFALAAAAVVALGYRALGYAGIGAVAGRGLWTARAVALVLLLLLALHPRLEVEVQEVSRGRLAVLLDDSLSMRIADSGGRSRGSQLERVFAPPTGEVARALPAGFDVDYFRFSDQTEPLGNGQELAFAGPRSDLGRALEQVLESYGGAGAAGTLAAIVVVSDGNVEASAGLDAARARLQAAGVRLYAVGVGSERFSRDVEVSAVRMPRRVFAGETVTAEVVVRQRGLEGAPLPIRAEEDGIVVAERTLPAPGPAGRATIALSLAFPEPGPRRLAFRVPLQAGENVAQNNVLHREIEVRAGPIRVLHFEGEPRFEVKFLRRAVAQDEVIRLVSLVRTAQNKYFRLGVDSAAELADGFPDSREALQPYDVLILGSAEAGLLGEAAQAAIRDFVAHRGGGLLLLGGRRALAEGGYRRSLLAGVLPVLLEEPAGFRSAVRVRSVDGEAAAQLGLGAPGDPRWDALPPLTVVNPIRRVKPGASIWLEGADAAGGRLVVLAAHRYGRGNVAVLAVRDSWRWQMHAPAGQQDGPHTTLWRGLVRWLARPSSARVQLAELPEEVAPGQTLPVRAEVLDARFEPVTDAAVALAVTNPLGEVEMHRMQPALDDSRRYETSYTPREPGRYELRVQLATNGTPNGAANGATNGANSGANSRADGGGDPESPAVVVRVSPNGREFHAAELDRARLTELAGSTGGRFFALTEAAGLVAALEDARGTRRRLERLPLHDAPAALIGLLLLLCAEWWLRRRRRLP